MSVGRRARLDRSWDVQLLEVTFSLETPLARTYHLEKIMDAAHLHLAITHAPLFGTIFGLGVLVYALIRKSDDVRSAAYGAFALSGLLAVAVYLSGRGAEHVVEDLPGVIAAFSS
jgi:hypothetical protein